jgi:hypothetical protein
VNFVAYFDEVAECQPDRFALSDLLDLRLSREQLVFVKLIEDQRRELEIGDEVIEQHNSILYCER